jgi:hypothetical protein
MLTTPLFLRRFFHMNGSGRAGLKMHVIRGGSTTLWSVVEDGVPRTQVSCQLKKSQCVRAEELWNVIDVRDREVLTEDWSRIAEDKKFVSVQNPLLLRWQILNAQEAWPLTDRLGIDLRARTDNPARVELKPDRIAGALNFT